MAKKKETQFVCSECGFDTPRWEGQCPSCKEWNTLGEFKAASSKSKVRNRSRGFASAEPVTLAQVTTGESARIGSGMSEVDRCLGGGFVPDEVVLVAGEPGIGKSTLLLQIASSLSGEIRDTNSEIRVLYVAGEESPSQIKLRADRLDIETDKLAILPETDVDTVSEVISRTSPTMVIVDSIQTMQSGGVEAAAGSPLQIRTCTQVLFQQAKHEKFILVVVGHITKEGNIAGPKLLEHMVDAVLYLEGDAVHAYRLLRVYKNRFGATDEVGVFSMTQKGLEAVKNPSAVFLEGRPEAQAGSVVVPVVKGNRCFMVEIQALVSPTSFSMPRRTVSGIDFNRAALIIAVLQKKAGIDLTSSDVFVSVAGGMKVDDVGADLGIALAMASSATQRPLAADTSVYGEIGLAGELRAVSHAPLRDKEATKLGYGKLVSPSQHKTLKEALKVLRT